MRNYLNENDRKRHLVIQTCKCVIDEMLEEADALTDNEKGLLRKASRAINNFTISTFIRFGPAYKRKLSSTLKCNEIVIQGKYAAQRDCISHIATEDLVKQLDALQAMKCIDCDGSGYIDCAVYNICLACDCIANGKERGCPYKIEFDTDFDN